MKGIDPCQFHQQQYDYVLAIINRQRIPHANEARMNHKSGCQAKIHNTGEGKTRVTVTEIQVNVLDSRVAVCVVTP